MGFARLQGTMLTRSKEILALAMIGDGLLGLVQTQRHFSLWTIGPAPVRKVADYFTDRPLLSKAASAAELVAGLYLASCQTSAKAHAEEGVLAHAG